jgi:hypothetical protein
MLFLSGISSYHKPIPRDFGGYILQLAITLKAHNDQHEADWIFDYISIIVASSVLLDCVRLRKGKTAFKVFYFCYQFIEQDA